MSFLPSFKEARVVSNTDIVNEFKCANMGGMRRSKKTNTLVIISDQTKGLYEDKWHGDILHYTGMGKNGDQDINSTQNKTLNESDTNGIEIHLFEVLEPKKYIYKGQVVLHDDPYQDKQKGADGILRNVWMFPVRQRSGDHQIDEKDLQKFEERLVRKARSLSTVELKQKAEDRQSDRSSVRKIISTTYLRDQFVSEYAKRVAYGICQLCGMEAPFIDNGGVPYLETHHIEWLSRGGDDIIENVVALCPNCHRKIHVLDLDEDKAILNDKKR